MSVIFFIANAEFRYIVAAVNLVARYGHVEEATRILADAQREAPR